MFLGTHKSQLTREGATELFRGSWRERRVGRVCAVTELYLPYHLFQVSVPDRKPSRLAIDAVAGDLDLHRFDPMPALDNASPAGKARVVPASLGADGARERIIERALRMLFLEGFFKRNRSGLTADWLGELHLPYWVGFYDHRGQVRIEVLDGYRKRFEGEKMRQLVARVLASSSDAPANVAETI